MHHVYMVYNHRPTPTHQQATYQQPTHLQQKISNELQNSFETSRVRMPNKNMLLSALQYIRFQVAELLLGIRQNG
jgi:hypothetical protein